VSLFSRLIASACLLTASLLVVSAAQADEIPKIDLGLLIRDAVKSGKPTLKLPAGTHRISETLFINDARNLVIDGTGVTLVMTNQRQGIFYLANCDRVIIRGLTLDYDPLPYVQATITKADRAAFEFAVHAGYPDLTPDFSGAPTHLFSNDGKRHSDAFDFYRARIEVLSARTGIAHANGKWPSSLAPGDKVVFDRRELDRTNAVEIRNNTGPVIFEDITLLSSPTLGFAGRYCEAPVTFRRVTLKPGPLPTGATEPRLFSSNADAINFIGCRQGPIIENCDISGQGDDSLNIHGMFLPVARVLSPTRFLTVYPYGIGGFVKPLRAGDTLRMYSKGDFAPAGEATLASLKPLADTEGFTAADVTPLYPSYNSSKFTVYQVDLASPATLTAGHWFDVPAINGNGYIIRDSYFHDHRGRGLRLMASDGLVENNRFERLTKSAISIGPELGFWREAGWVKNLRVTGNKLRDIGVDASLAAEGSYVPGAIGIFVRNDIGKSPYPPGNDNIVIENNTIDGSSVAGIHAYAVRGLVIRNNTLRNTNLVRKAGTTDPTNHLATSGPISTEGTTDVRLDGNTLGSAASAR
jgi:parallel beta-helix repeat protein